MFGIFLKLILAVFTFALVTLCIALDSDMPKRGAGRQQAINFNTFTH